MSFNDFDAIAGQGALVQSDEKEVLFTGIEAPLVKTQFWLHSSTVDARSTDTTQLQPGLVLGRRDADDYLAEYDATATDGTQIAYAILGRNVNMQSLGEAAAKDRQVGEIVIGGFVKADKLGGLDGHARSALAGRFVFDDEMNLPYQGFNGVEAVTANQTLNVVYDNGKRFTNQGAVGAVVLTLPATISKNFFVELFVEAAQNFSFAGSTNIVAVGNASASSVLSAVLGTVIRIRANADATKWLAECDPAVTVS